MPHGRDRTVVGFITSYDCMQSVRGVLDTTLSDKSLSVTCASLVFLWFPPPIKLSDCHCITEIFLKVALNTITIRVITKLPNIEQNSQVNKQTKSVNNRKTGKTVLAPDLVQAFLKKWWVESDFTAPNLLLPLRLKGSGCHYNSIFNNTGTN
jgi:hypothetical protein